MEVNEVHREGSTLSHTPDELQVLLIMVLVLGQRRVWVVPATVSGQERTPVVSLLQITFAANGEVEWCVYVIREESRITIICISY